MELIQRLFAGRLRLPLLVATVLTIACGDDDANMPDASTMPDAALLPDGALPDGATPDGQLPSEELFGEPCDLIVDAYRTGEQAAASSAWPTCERGLEAVEAFEARLVPVLLIPSDVDDVDAATAERVAQSLVRVQRWMLAETGVSLDVDRVMRIDSPSPRSVFTGDNGDADMARVARTVDARVGGLLRAGRVYVTFVMGVGGEATQLRDTIDERRNALFMSGDALADLPELCFDEADSAAECDRSVTPGDAALAEAAIHAMIPSRADELLGLDFAFDAMSDPALVETLAESALVSARNVIYSGHIQVSSDIGGVRATAAGPSAVAAVWEAPIGVEEVTTLRASIVSLNATNDDGAVLAEVDLAQNTAPLCYTFGGERSCTSNITGGAAVAYDASNNRFAFVYSVHREGTDLLVKPLFLRFVDAATGVMGPEFELAPETTRNDKIVAAYHGGHLYVMWGNDAGNINQGGVVYAGIVDLSAATPTMGEPMLLASNGRVGGLAVDPSRGRVLSTFAERTVATRYEVHGQFIAPVGFVAPNDTALAEPAPFYVAGGAAQSMFSSPAYDVGRDVFTVAYWQNGGGANWDTLTTNVGAQSGVADAAPTNLTDGRLAYQRRPGLAYIPSADRMLVAYGDDAGRDDTSTAHETFFDGISRITAQVLDGSSDGQWIGVHQEYDAFDATAVAPHPTDDLGFVLRSGLNGVHLELVRFDTNSYEETTCIPFDGGSSNRVAPGTLGAVTVSVLNGSSDEGCARFYVDRGEELSAIAPIGDCEAVGDPIRIGVMNGATFGDAPQVTVQPPSPLSAPATTAATIATDVQCWGPNGGMTLGNARFDGTGYTFDLERNGTCQLLHCPQVEMEVERIEENSRNTATACQTLEDNDLIGRSGDIDDWSGSPLYFVHSAEISWAAVEGVWASAHGVYDLWNMQSIGMSAYGETRTFYDFSFGASGYVGFAAAPRNSDDILHAWHNRTQYWADSPISLPIPFLSAQFRYFGMLDISAAPLIVGAQAGVNFAFDFTPNRLVEALENGTAVSSSNWLADGGLTSRQLRRAERVNPPDAIAYMPGETLAGARERRVGYGYSETAEPLPEYTWADRGRMMGYSMASVAGLDTENLLVRRVGRLVAAVGRARDEAEARSTSIGSVCCASGTFATVQQIDAANTYNVSGPLCQERVHTNYMNAQAWCEHRDDGAYRVRLTYYGEDHGEWTTSGCSTARIDNSIRRSARGYCCDSDIEHPNPW